jgi:hypothetical protein
LHKLWGGPPGPLGSPLDPPLFALEINCFNVRDSPTRASAAVQENYVALGTRAKLADSVSGAIGTPATVAANCGKLFVKL